MDDTGQPPDDRSPRGEAVAQPSPQTGASIGRGTTVLRARTNGPPCGTRPSTDEPFDSPSHRRERNGVRRIYATATGKSESPAAMIESCELDEEDASRVSRRGLRK